ncbi:MAG: hypothetical protein NVSMB52_20380 [Chloroflexota bacterium]
MTALSTIVSRGATASRPAVGTAGQIFFDTTLGKLPRDNGSTWDDLEAVSPQGPAGKLGYTQITANQSTTSTTYVDVPGLSVTVTVGTRPLKITAYAPLINNTVAGNGGYWKISDVTGAADIQLARVLEGQTASTGMAVCAVAANVSPAAGSRTYKVQYAILNAGTLNLIASATSPAFILVEEI